MMRQAGASELRLNFRSQAGFSLLEVMVAFSVLALALGVLYHAVGGSVRNIQEVEWRTRAALLARSLADAYDSVPPGATSASGRNPDGMSWQVAATPLVPAMGQPVFAWPLYRVEVVVSWPGARRGGEYRVVTLRPERPEERTP